MTVRLTVIRGPNIGQIYEFGDNEITIGSGHNNSLVIRDNDVSTYHCRLLRIYQDYDIEDLNSRYGTFVDGQPIRSEKWLLRDGSIIELGSQVAFSYHLLEANPLVQPTAHKYHIDPQDSGTQPCLVLVKDGHIQSAYMLQSDEVSIGRSMSNHISLEANDVSRSHAKLIWLGDGFAIKDEASRNGTFVNGVPIVDTLRLQYSDVIRLGGNVQFHYVYRKDLPENWEPITPEGTELSVPEDTDRTLPALGGAGRGTKELKTATQFVPGALTDHIMLVYAREDWEPIVARLVLALNSGRQNVWVEQALDPNTEQWRATLEYAQSECWMLLMVLSPTALKQDHITDAYRYFYNREKPILLLDYKPTQHLPLQIAQAARIRYEADNLGSMFQQVLFQIMQMKPRSRR